MEVQPCTEFITFKPNYPGVSPVQCEHVANAKTLISRHFPYCKTQAVERIAQRFHSNKTLRKNANLRKTIGTAQADLQRLQTLRLPTDAVDS